MSYILLLDPRDETLHLQDLCLSRFYGGKVFARKSSREAIQVLERQGPPELIVIDHSLMKNDEIHAYMQEKDMPVPLIISADRNDHDEVLKFFPRVTAILDRPLNMQVFDHLVRSISKIPTQRPTHIPVLISTLLVFGQQQFDLFLKLSDSNFVKVVHRGESFSESDAIRFYTKGITHLYLSYSDGNAFLDNFEKSLGGALESRDKGTAELVALSLESFETVESMAKRLGWSRESIQVARKCINHALEIIAKDENLLKTLRRRLSAPSSAYRRHVGLLAYVVCLMGASYGQDAEAIQMKLAMAALLHDLGVDDKIYDEIRVWNKKAADNKDKSSETSKYRMHPFEAAKVIRSMDFLPPDVDQIVLQHHERPDGSGFPRGLLAQQISLLPSLFILAEELVDFIVEGDKLETSLVDFMTWGREVYQTAHFKKIFDMLEKRLKEL
jgi:CheY-like chemotaxis protein